MIVPMSKITLLCTAAGRDRSLEELRALGVLHLAPVTPPAGGDLDRARERREHIRRALEVLPEKAGGARRSAREPLDVVEEIWKLIHRRGELEQRLEELVHEEQRLEPYGSFDPASVERLRAAGVTVKLYHCARGERVDLPEGAVRAVLAEDKTGCYFAVFSRGALDLACPELRVPAQSLAAVQAGLKAVQEDLAGIQQSIAGFGGDRGKVVRILREAEEAVEFLEARQGMASAGAVAYLCGYCPGESLPRVREAAARHGWGLIVEEPAPGERVPTLIRNPRWLRPIETIYDAFGILPGYEEIDVSSVFLVFLSIFFAMIVGDAAYGAIFLGLTLWAQKKFPGVPARAFSFLKIMSTCTIIWGVMTGSYFFIPVLPTVFTKLKVAWLSNEDNVKYLTFLLGAVHLSIAHAWSAWRMRRSLKAIAQVGWICVTWTMFFGAGSLVLGRPFPAWITPVGLFGVVAVILFMTPVGELKGEWFNHVLLPLTIVSNFIDIVSYIRLYAVGVAGAAIATSFASMVLTGVDSFLSGLFAAVILFFAHALNIVLSALSVLVHGVRLNVLEFTNHIGMQWSGFAYQPFARREAADAKSSK